MHLSQDFYENGEGWWEPKCECGWSEGVVPDAETAADALMQHARERALIEDIDLVRGAQRQRPVGDGGEADPS